MIYYPAVCKNVMRSMTGTALLLTGLVLAGCAQNAAVSGPKLRIYAADVTGGAKKCEVPKVNPTAGQTTETAIKLANDGGWCGISVHQDGPKPYGAGLLTARPAHGSVTIHSVGDDTRIDYTPDKKYSGSDSFEVKMVPGNAILRVAVEVSAT